MSKSDAGAVLIFIGFGLAFWTVYTEMPMELFIATTPPLIVAGIIMFFNGIHEEEKEKKAEEEEAKKNEPWQF